MGRRELTRVRIVSFCRSVRRSRSVLILFVGRYSGNTSSRHRERRQVEQEHGVRHKAATKSDKDHVLQPRHTERVLSVSSIACANAPWRLQRGHTANLGLTVPCLISQYGVLSLRIQPWHFRSRLLTNREPGSTANSGPEGSLRARHESWPCWARLHARPKGSFPPPLQRPSGLLADLAKRRCALSV